MSSIQEPEIQFAQRLACNEKAIRNKALKKLRKYVSVRSLKLPGGFTGDELLKLWKGLFYCLWMQDKPLLQEELSDHISTLIHSFHQFDTQMLYLESFLNTVKREWTGIDRLRMDKFFQLVRFMFRQTFEVLKRKNWESSAIAKFLELLTAQLLQTTSGAPSGLQFHILDLYMTELASVGSAELTATQNLMFIEPFCKTAAKTKDLTLLSAICKSIFSAIIDQAPFAIEDLMKEVQEAEASDSDLSKEHSEEQEPQVTRKGAVKRLNGSTSKEEDDSGEETDTEMSCDDNIGPVLQFDYAAVADKLLKFASLSGTPGPNRLRLYKIIKVLRDLSEGIFPQDVYPEEVSTDEDDDMFGSRKKIKRRESPMNGTNELTPAAKKRKKKEDLEKQNKDNELSDLAASDEKKNMKKKKEKNRAEKKGETSVKVTESAVSGVLPETERSTQCLDEANQSLHLVSMNTSKKRKRNLPVPKFEEQQTPTVDQDVPSKTYYLVSEKKKKKKKRKKDLVDERDKELSTIISGVLDEDIRGAPPISHASTPTDKMNKGSEHDRKNNETDADSHDSPVSCEPLQEIPHNDTECTALTKKSLKAKGKLENAACINGLGLGQDAMHDCPNPGLDKNYHTAAPSKQKGQKKDLKADDDVAEGQQYSTKLPTKNTKKKGKQNVEINQPIEESVGKTVSCGSLLKNIPIVKDSAGTISESLQVADCQNQLFEITISTPTKKITALQPTTPQLAETHMDTADRTDEQEVVAPSGKAVKRKKRKIPVAFEFEEPETAVVDNLTKEETKLTNEDQAPALVSKKVTFGLKNNKTAEFRKTDRSLLVSPVGTSRVPFDPQQKPKCGVLKSPLTLLSKSNKKTRFNTSNNLLQKRPSAADFF